jgi:hypothetical protein
MTRRRTPAATVPAMLVALVCQCGEQADQSSNIVLDHQRDSLLIDAQYAETLTVCPPGTWIAHGGNGPVFLRGNTIVKTLPVYEEKSEEPRCW